MNTLPAAPWIAFAEHRRIARGEPREVAAIVKGFVDSHPEKPVAVFDAVTSQPIDLDLRGSTAAVLERLPAAAPEEAPPGRSPPVAPPRGPGRPKLGVVAREVTLLPRHWDWLGTQPGGASVALRKLVEAAQRARAASDLRREAIESAYRFMHAMAGDAPASKKHHAPSSPATRSGCEPKWPPGPWMCACICSNWPEHRHDRVTTRMPAMAFIPRLLPSLKASSGQRSPPSSRCHRRWSRGPRSDTACRS